MQFVVQMRHHIPYDELRAMQDAGAYGRLVDLGAIGDGELERSSIGRVLGHEDFAAGQLLAGGRPSGGVVGFSLENGRWRLQLSDLLRTLDRALADQTAEVPRDLLLESIAETIAEESGRPLSPAIWDPAALALEADARLPFDLSELGPPRFARVEGETVLEGGGTLRVVRHKARRQDLLWLYLPPGEHADGSLACVLIAPAGTNLATGNALGEGSRAEHLPYLEAGFAVLAYELDGALEDEQDEDARVEAMTAFRDARAGLANARVALEYLLAEVPEVDADRLFAAGHSSAATHALLFAAHEPRLAGCAAYAPAVDLVESWGAESIDAVTEVLPWFRAFCLRSSPSSHVGRIECPVLLFHSETDTITSYDGTVGFARELRRSNPRVTLSSVPRGGHYDSMLDTGIPRAIAWMRTQ